MITIARVPLTPKLTIFIYDNHPGGVGFSKRLFNMHDDLLKAARDLIAECKCESGCPSCVGPALEVGEAGKKSAMILLA